MMRQTLKTAVFILVMSVAAAAQGPTIEYGRADDLKGVARVFLFTDTDVERANPPRAGAR